MNSPLTNAVLKHGLISHAVLEQFRRWKVPVVIPDDTPTVPSADVDEIALAISEVLEGDGLVLTRETDLQVLQYYFQTQRTGHLHMEIMTDDPTITSEADMEVTFGVTPVGDVIFPWKSESIAAELTNGMSYLTPNPLLEGRIYFQSVHELFFGNHKAFIVCTPRLEEGSLALGEGGDDADGNP